MKCVTADKFKYCQTVEDKSKKTWIGQMLTCETVLNMFQTGDESLFGIEICDWSVRNMKKYAPECVEPRDMTACN